MHLRLIYSYEYRFAMTMPTPYRSRLSHVAGHLAPTAAAESTVADEKPPSSTVWESEAGRSMSMGTLDPRAIPRELLVELMRPGCDPYAETETETQMAIIAAQPPTMSDGTGAAATAGPSHIGVLYYTAAVALTPAGFSPMDKFRKHRPFFVAA